MPLFRFNFDMKDISKQRIQYRIQKYLAPPTNFHLLEFLGRIVKSSNFYLLRSTISGFNPIHTLKEFIFILKKADVFNTLYDFLRSFHRAFKGYFTTWGSFLGKSILYSLFETLCISAFFLNKTIDISFSCTFLGEYELLQLVYFSELKIFLLSSLILRFNLNESVFCFLFSLFHCEFEVFPEFFKKPTYIFKTLVVFQEFIK